MKKLHVFLPVLVLLAGCPNGSLASDGLFTRGQTADHTVVTQLWTGQIPEVYIQAAKDSLVIGYGHTSHGSQITDGMDGLVAFANGANLGTPYSTDLFSWSHNGAGDTLHLFEGDGYGTGPLDHDAGYYPNWVDETEEFLDDPANSNYNVIMWSWCGQVSGYSSPDLVDRYLTPMSNFEAMYPDVVFVYMTGHLDGTGETGTLHLRNEEIRRFCADNDKWLFDFADIESHDPEGNYYVNRAANDNCDYDSDGNGSRDSNWAIDWQNSHTVNTDWYNCGSAHSLPLNANMKAYAAWWLFVQIAHAQ